MRANISRVMAEIKRKNLKAVVELRKCSGGTSHSLKLFQNLAELVEEDVHVLLLEDQSWSEADGNLKETF